MKKRRFVIVAGVALCGVAAYCLHSSHSSVTPNSAVVAQDNDAAQQAAPADPPVIVAVEKSIGLTSLQARQYAGRVEAIESVSIVPRVTGWIQKINFKEGDFVKAGDLLFELEDTTYQAAYLTAKGKCAQAEAVKANAQISYDRAKGLLERNAGSQADYDNAEQALKVADANLAVANASLTDAENTLSYTKISSPISGRIGKVTVTQGNLVTPQTGQLVDVRQFAPIHIKFAIGESVFNGTFGGESKIRDLAFIRVCPVGSSRTDVKAIETYPQATIDLVDNHVDPSTNTVYIWATLTNEDNRFYPGSYATVMLSRKLDKPVPAVLQSAIQTAPEGNYVWIEKDGKPEQRFVQLGPISDSYYVINSGLEIGEDVVVEGMNKIKPTSTLQVVPYASWESSNANGAPAEAAGDAQADSAQTEPANEEK